MRFIDLMESVAKYRPMFNVLPELDSTKVADTIRQIESQFKREDRVVWALRWMRLRMALDAGITPESPQWPKIIKGLPRLDDSSLGFHSASFEQSLPAFAHFFSLGANAIDRVVFSNQTPNQIINVFEELEKEWQAQRRQIIDHGIYDYDDDDDDDSYPYTEYDFSIGDNVRKSPVRGRPEVMIDFHNGWAWWDLNRAYCRAEGSAMGHCGNSAEPGEDDTVLSLRRHIGGNEYRPSCTFILNQHGFLGEMKGRANEKPKREYHDMIIALLLDPRIKGISGGGYQPDHNFSILDIAEPKRSQLIEQKPSLLTPMEAVNLANEQNNDESMNVLETRLRAGLEPHGLKFKNLQKIGGEILAVINEWSSLGEVEKRSRYLDDVEGFFNDLYRGFREIGVDDLQAWDFSHRAHDLYHDPVAKIYLRLYNDFELNGVRFAFHGERVLLVIPVEKLARPSGRNDPDFSYDDSDEPRFVFDRISSLSSEPSEEGFDENSWWDGDKEISWKTMFYNRLRYHGIHGVDQAMMAILEFLDRPFKRKENFYAAVNDLREVLTNPDRTEFSRDKRQGELFDPDTIHSLKSHQR